MSRASRGPCNDGAAPRSVVAESGWTMRSVGLLRWVFAAVAMTAGRAAAQAQAVDEERAPTLPPGPEPSPPMSCPLGQQSSLGHCCWQGQVWSVNTSRCVGAPVCPPEHVVRNNDDCVRAPADTEPASAPHGAAPHDSDHPRRDLGLGSAFGGGVAAAVADLRSGGRVLPALMLPTFEIRHFANATTTLDVSIPVVNMITVWASGIFAATADVTFNVNAGTANVRGIAGAGGGLALALLGPIGVFSIRVPAQFGVEFVTSHRSFGVGLLARPWLEIGFAFGSGTAAAVGGGVLGVLEVMGYFVQGG